MMSCLVALLPSSAQAASGWISAPDGVLYDSCEQYKYQYSVSPPTSEWSMDVDLTGPDGAHADSDFVYSDEDPTSSVGDIQFCGWEQPGRYTIRATLSYYDYEYNEYRVALPAASFVMREPRSRTTLKVSDKTPRFDQVVRLVARTRDERPAGFYATSHPTVVLQVRKGRKWVRVKGAVSTGNDRGVTTWNYRWNTRKTAKIRAMTRGSGYSSSISRSVRVNPS